MAKAIFKRYSSEACEWRKSRPTNELCADESASAGWRSGYEPNAASATVRPKDLAILSEYHGVAYSQLV